MANESWMFVVITMYLKLVIKYFSFCVENYLHGTILKFLHKFSVVDIYTHQNCAHRFKLQSCVICL